MKNKARFLSLLLLLIISSIISAQVTDTTGNKYLRKVEKYADAMMKDGRDGLQYGPDTCPMFAVYLRRENNSLPAFPEFRISGETFYDLDHSGGWAYRSFLNIPMMSKKNPENGNHGQDKAHKQTVTGADPLENGGMYLTFEKLSAVTGNSKYNDAVLEALNWFAPKQASTGLFPFGEHSGWDFYYNSPCYLTTINNNIPNNWKSPNDAPLYHAWEHEPNGAYEKFVPFYDFLRKNHPARFKAYCRGLWEQHFWDKDKGFFNRHGDIYPDSIDGWGSHPDDYYGCFPRMTRIFAEVWTDGILAFPNDITFKTDMLTYLHKLIDGRILDRTNSDGSLIFDRRSGGKKPQIPRQYLSMIHGVEDAANKIEHLDTALASKMRTFTTQQWDWFFSWIKPNNGYQGSDWASAYAIGDIFSIQGAHKELHQPSNGMTNWRLDTMFWYYADGIADGTITVSDYNAKKWATMIDYMIYAYDVSGTLKYLNKAKEFADWTLDNYFDGNSALPKCVNFGLENVYTLETANGDIWEPPYDAQMGSADLMYSLLDLYSTISGNEGVITSVENVQSNQLQLFPNPTNDLLTVNLKEPAIIKIYDQNGRLIILNENSLNTQKFDLSKLTNGIYTIKAITQSEVLVGRVIKK